MVTSVVSWATKCLRRLPKANWDEPTGFDRSDGATRSIYVLEYGQWKWVARHANVVSGLITGARC